ncbi:MAG: ATP-binding cassette domain-containing protein [Bifidobacteriaceae bacterium]|jgi:putative ABC transport system ATP-binding protein/lipoprotein-releasing system ATP-binding protein|nr:ATP-binding cassette domain-containing protein [Bifidobacteriaceae bacterium]
MTVNAGDQVNPALTVTSLEVSFGGRPVLAGLDLAVSVGESVSVMGPSGCGKTTLLNCVLGLVRPSAGDIWVSGKPVTGASKRSVSRIRSGLIGVVFQHGELIGELGGLQNVAVAAMLAGRDRRTAVAAADALMTQFGLDIGGPAVDSLSGGERQRVALARALVNEPMLILADEPTASLDAANRAVVAECLFATTRQRRCGLLVVTHDRTVAQMADRQVTLEQGVVRPVGMSASQVDAAR